MGTWSIAFAKRARTRLEGICGTQIRIIRSWWHYQCWTSLAWWPFVPHDYYQHDKETQSMAIKHPAYRCHGWFCESRRTHILPNQLLWRVDKFFPKASIQVLFLRPRTIGRTQWQNSKEKWQTIGLFLQSYNGWVFAGQLRERWGHPIKVAAWKYLVYWLQSWVWLWIWSPLIKLV